MKEKIGKRKYLILFPVLIIGIIISVLLCRNRLQAVERANAEASEESGFSTVPDDTLVVENDTFVFRMDVKSTHFTVENKSTGTTWNSVSPADEETGKGNSSLSELMIDYYDANSMKGTMYSNDNSVAFEACEVRQNGDTVRVYYELRKEKDDFFVPAAFAQEIFEEEVLTQLEVGPRKRLQKYYKLQGDLYVVSDEIGTNAYREITGYLAEAGYTQADYEEDKKELDTTETAIDMPAKFLVPVEYTLNEDGFTAKVLTDLITVGNDSYTLTDVHLLPAFGSVMAQAEGYLLVPDGSGGLISFQEEKDILYSQQIYGIDRAVNEQQNLQHTMQAVMPVYGMNRTDSGMFCVIEQGAECAIVQGQVSGSVNVMTGIYADFQIRAYDVTEIGAVSEKGSYNLYAKKGMSVCPQVRYVLLEEGNCDYVAMAQCYQQYLVKQGVLKEQMTEAASTLYLDFTGYLTQESSLLGIPYDKKILLSDLEGMEAFLEELKTENLTKVSVRLKGYSHGGTKHALIDAFELDSCIGTKERLTSLSALLQEHGGYLYLEDDVDAVYKNTLFDKFQRLTHAVRRIDRMVVTRGDYDIVLNDADKQFDAHFILSPRYYETLVENFADTLEKKLGDCSDYGYSWSGYGTMLTGDYNASCVIDRTTARQYGDAAIQQAAGFSDVMTETGNMYAVAYADTLLAVPLSDSSFQSVTVGVPFYQVVLHGYRTFTGAAFNTVSDPETEWLKTVESGAALYYNCMTEDYSVIKDMNYRQTLYPVSTELCKSDIISKYQAYAELYEQIAAQRIVEHEVNEQNGLHITTYEDGTAVIVNYGDEPVTYGTVLVEARNFTVQ